MTEAKETQPTTSSTGQKTWTPEQERIREALRVVVDPELGMDVVTLGLIRDIIFREDETEIQMVMTTPFCPYAGVLIQQVQQVAATVVDGPVRVTLLDEMWDPSMMEGGDLFANWGLV